MSISASMVKELRERTGAGMMECKKALVETSGDMEAAAELLRKSGQAKADKKAGRVAADGKIVVKADAGNAVVVEVNSETDFVAKDENFISFAEAVADVAMASGTTDVEALANETLADGRSVEQARTDLISKVGENISVRRIAAVTSGGPLGHYTHGAKIGAVVALEGGDADLARDIAMHVAAINPTCIDESGVPAKTLERERRIFAEQAAESGKPPEIVEKMVSGRVAKFLKEITLVGQPFVKDDKISVGKLLGKAGAKVTSFVRFEVGEGIEKKQENFADEVMKQIEDAKSKG
ncbi:MAG: translation elongation factor Ts [Gammaproteobacteria bacterium]|jgi:elongation factor Ts|nr:translation elongation factor Ts [Gammaproteobacteria bacterium]MDH3865015.1 translation elongation factor Ts [Gammaproteobacteria bacterium]MDH3907124.1 translation elongation factor Ts [Gammaproteobacteria bacterium]MDH4006066.1 translation elongation factor Ts [Gammaproteobacteria bacterium]NCF60778.1 elongation factor Ts [Gammaproteobacteria bacterium]